MEKVTIHEVKELHITINEPFCVIQHFLNGKFEFMKSVGDDKVMTVHNIEGISAKILPIDQYTAQKINRLADATEADIEEVNFVINVMLNNL